LSLACCLATGGELLLLDEPVAGVAPGMVEKILGLITDLRSRGKTVVFIEHNFAAVTEVCDRVLFMDEGRLVAEGTPTEIRDNAEVIESYLT
jgi:ABC-type branched-subunit amino acid transport system ATPase component